MPDKILIVEDNPQLLEAVQRIFEKEGYRVITAGDGQEGMRMVYAERPDLVILDVMMPRLDGWQVCQRIREMSDVPIILLTARVEEEDIIKGLALGADDYLTKPFSVNELLARVRAVLRRARTEAVSLSSGVTYRDDYLSIDLDARRVAINGELVDLTPTEYKLLALLVENKGRALAFREILESVWGFEYAEDVEYVRVYAWHLRRKIEPDPRQPRYLINELNVGYRFEPQR
jgi:two-component system KDP operon response regulator KdpE